MDYTGRTVVVTGGAGALGTAVVGALLDAGARCVVPVHAEHELRHFPHTDRVQVVKDCDLRDERGVQALYAAAGPLWASIHIAGGFAMQPLARTDRAALMDMLEMNLVTAYLCCRAAAAAMPAGAGGRIVNIAARPGLEPRSGAGKSAYAISKAGVVAMTEALGAELADAGILVNAVAPSTIDTPANRAAMPGAAYATWPTPAQIAATILYLASPSNTVTSGAVVPVYGRA